MFVCLSYLLYFFSLVLCPSTCEQLCNDTISGALCYCRSGYKIKQGESNKCENIDECTLKTHTCDASATCVDTVGSYNCQCPTGTSGNGRSPCIGKNIIII